LTCSWLASRACFAWVSFDELGKQSPSLRRQRCPRGDGPRRGRLSSGHLLRHIIPSFNHSPPSLPPAGTRAELDADLMNSSDRASRRGPSRATDRPTSKHAADRPHGPSLVVEDDRPRCCNQPISIISGNDASTASPPTQVLDRTRTLFVSSRMRPSTSTAFPISPPTTEDILAGLGQPMCFGRICLILDPSISAALQTRFRSPDYCSFITLEETYGDVVRMPRRTEGNGAGAVDRPRRFRSEELARVATNRCLEKANSNIQIQHPMSKKRGLGAVRLIEGADPAAW